ncbi:MAG: aspartate carbamoyltransferase regulatory subunit [Clostridiales bacterium]|nr:aspartate carbamoyltransferase regulatory subunit [Clostridiales bacterium]
MIVGQIKNGIVLDHITAGKCMEIYDALGLADLACTVAVIKNADSQKHGKKDILKVFEVIDLDLDILGYLDPGITVNIIKDGKVSERKHLSLPEKVTGIIRCKNPRCITSVEQALPHVFKLTDREQGLYRCIYCESKAK